MSRWIVIRARKLPVSFRLDARVPFVVLVLAALSLAVIILSIGMGQYPIAPADVVRTILGHGPREYNFVVNTLRFPRALVAFLVGTGLGISGAILQGLTRNPLASPDVIGLSAGAGVGATFVILLLPKAPWSALPLAALCGALAAVALTYMFGWKKGSSTTRLILVGIGISAIGQAIINMVVAISKTTRVAETMIWLTGSVYGRSWTEFRGLIPWLAVFIPAALLLARHLDVLAFGDDVARGLGGRVELQRGLLLLTSVALAAASAAAAGTVSFVGLIAPHMARRLVGPGHSGVIPTAGVLGGLLVVTADLLGRMLFAPIEVPAGVVNAAVGAPYFLYLLYRSRNQ